jgi:CopG family transcriptional regulator / antitoxin EndoAI
MTMNRVRLNITLPQELARQLEMIAGARMRSKFIADAVSERIEALRKEEVSKDMAEGYRVRREESLLLAKDFEAADLEHWDDY